ncbi:MerR family transcriptional regulator [Rhodopirellula sp. P2]|uniref:MerR family transcriptional regulator n=1 Tax=Rhodopirellula sp. P2 TaxID=2127060 RepID=UPI002368CCDB|nr:tetratricopeptide repeat protein [Rhodopirellula sp. P2]WDQ19514.1 MerR family DNA-binding transcriptional regulator [Rhodopirellula sp. P2]
MLIGYLVGIMHSNDDIESQNDDLANTLDGELEDAHFEMEAIPFGSDSGDEIDRDDDDAEEDDTEGFDPEPLPSDALSGRRMVIVGRLGGMNRREATNLLRSYGAVVVESEASAVDCIVIGAEESPLAEAELIERATERRGDDADVEILHETDLWQQLGLVDAEQSIRQLHTPAMLAHLLGVSVRVIRRWHRRGLIRPVRTLHKLPYFDFQEVATARRLAAWVASGASPEAIERRIMQWVEVVPNLRRPLDQLSILVEGKHVLLRQGEGLIEPGGQLRFDFDALEDSDESATEVPMDTSILPFSRPGQSIAAEFGSASSDPMSARTSSPAAGLSTNAIESEHNSMQFPPAEDLVDEEDDLLLSAYQAEDSGELETAIDCYHAVLARDGARSDIHFQIGELLYRIGETIAARERYYAALEVDPDFVEARSSLAGVLAETGQPELAVAAYRGALALHDDYPDVHYNLARILEDLHRSVEAEHHWRRFLQLSPGSPWADEAHARLEELRQSEQPDF